MELERLLYDALVETTPKPFLAVPSDIEFYSFMDKLWSLQCNHTWSFPFTTKNLRYPKPYDTHQVCTECSRTRFFQFKSKDDVFKPGPYFRRVINKERVAY